MKTSRAFMLVAAVILVTGLTGRGAILANLSGIGKAILIYSNDWPDELPRAGGRSSAWVDLGDFITIGPPQWPHTPPDPAIGPERINSIALTVVAEVIDPAPANASIMAAVCPPGGSHYNLADWVALGEVPIEAATGTEVAITFDLIGGDAPEWPLDGGWELWSQDNPFWVRAGGSGLQVVESIVTVIYTPTAAEILQYTAEYLGEVIEANPDTSLTDDLGGVWFQVLAAYQKLADDVEIALRYAEEAANDLDTLSAGSFEVVDTEYVKDLLAAAGQGAAMEAICVAEAAGGSVGQIDRAILLLGKGDNYWTAGGEADALDKYGDAANQACDALEAVSETD